jgi:hypothetical protein
MDEVTSHEGKDEMESNKENHANKTREKQKTKRWQRSDHEMNIPEGSKLTLVVGDAEILIKHRLESVKTSRI